MITFKKSKVVLTTVPNLVLVLKTGGRDSFH